MFYAYNGRDIDTWIWNGSYKNQQDIHDAKWYRCKMTCSHNWVQHSGRILLLHCPSSDINTCIWNGSYKNQQDIHDAKWYRCKMTSSHNWVQHSGRIYSYTVRASVSESVSKPLTELCLNYIRGSDLRSSKATAILVETTWTGSFEHAYCTNLGRTWASVSEEITTCSYELGHGHLRLKSWTQTLIRVDTKHKISCFDCVLAPDSDAWTVILDVLYWEMRLLKSWRASLISRRLNCTCDSTRFTMMVKVHVCLHIVSRDWSILTCKMVNPDLKMMSSISSAFGKASGLIIARVLSTKICGGSILGSPSESAVILEGH